MLKIYLREAKKNFSLAQPISIARRLICA